MSESENGVDMRTEVEIALNFPFDFEGERITSLIMRRPKVRDKLKANKVKGDDDDRALALMAELIERPVEIFHEMDEIDANKFGEQYARFTGRTPETDAS